MMKTVSFVIPCYRSAQTIEKVVAEIQNTMEDLHRYQYEIVLVYDCSPDDTFSVISRIARESDHIMDIDL